MLHLKNLSNLNLSAMFFSLGKFRIAVLYRHIFGIYCLYSPRLLRNIREFGEKEYFTDHHTPNMINGFRDSFLVHKMQDSSRNKNFEQNSIPIQAMQAITKTNHFKKLLNVFSTTCIYSNCIVDQLFY